MTRGGGDESNRRLLRVGETIRHALSDILSRDEIADPALSGLPVTVSAVEVRADLRRADVFVVPLLGERAEAVVDALNRHAGPIRGRLGGAIQLKYLPELRFKLDQSFGAADRIEALLRSDKVRRDLGPRGSGEG